MAEFEAALRLVLAHEGEYACDPADPGGETYRGIARKRHPLWPGWITVDSERGNDRFEERLRDNEVLQSEVAEFYRREFWDRVWGDEIPSQQVANEVFEQAVNLGPARAVEHLQRALNALNNRATLWADLAVDGWYAGRTHDAVVHCLKRRPERYLLVLLNVQQGAHYLSLMERDAKLERFVGWLARVSL